MTECFVKSDMNDEQAIVIEFRENKKPSYILRATTAQDAKEWITVLQQGKIVKISRKFLGN